MNKFNPNDKVVLKSEQNKKSPLVMIIKGRVAKMIPPDNSLNELANIHNIGDDQEVYLCEWIARRKPNSKLYDAGALVLAP